MPLHFLLDEDTRDNSLLNAIDRHNADQPLEFLDVSRVGDPGGPPNGIQDPELIQWATTWNRVIVSKDKNTLIHLHDQYVAMGNQTPGLLIIRPNTTILALVESLALIAHYSEPEEWQSQSRFIPM